MRRFHRLPVTVVVGVAAGVALLAGMTGSSAAKAIHEKTHVTITSTSATKFTGTVTSPKKACEKGRRVSLYRQEGSARLYGGPYEGFSLQGSTTTGPTGNWELDASSAFLEGEYRAAVAPKVVTAGGKKYFCSPVWGSFTHA